MLSNFALAAALIATQAPDAKPREQILVVSQAEHHLSILDAATLEIEAQVPTPQGPHEVVGTADGRTAYVMNYGGQTPGRTISVIDPLAGKEVERWDLGALRRPHGVARVGNHLWTTVELNNAIARIDLTTGEVDRVFGHGQRIGHMLALDPASERVFVANMLSSSVSVIETALRPGLGTVRTVEVPEQPEGIALTPDGSELWLGHRTGGHVTVIDTESLEILSSIDFGGFAYRLAPTPDGKHMLGTCNATGELVLMDVETHAVARRLPVGLAPAGFALSPDGTHAAVSLLADSTVVIVDLNTGELRKSAPTGASPDGIAWTRIEPPAVEAPAEAAGD